MRMKGLHRSLSFLTDKFFAKFFTAWFFSGAIMLLLHPGRITLGLANEINPILFGVIFLSIYMIASAWERAKKDQGRAELLMVIALLVFSCLLLARMNDLYVWLPLGIFFTLAMLHLRNRQTIANKDFPEKLCIGLSAAIAVFFAHIMLVISILRYETYSAPNFDFGIFCNMYYNMKHGFLPISSCERDQILSHFAVHISPALYLFLPIYCIFSSPVTVAVCQVLAIYSGIIPFLLIAKERGLSPANRTLFTAVYAASPILAGGCMFDFHENCLLVPMLLWMLYFHEKKKMPLFWLFALLTLLVKEDAFIYVIVFAAYLIFAQKKRCRGIALGCMAGGYFLIACLLLTKFGTGIMSGRFENMIPEGEGLLGIVKTLLFNPGYSVEQIFTTGSGDAQKLFYGLKLLAPLAFLPFMTKKSVRFLLILPIFLNLLTAYSYQYNIFFQYSFGIVTLLLYLSLLNVSDMPKAKQRFYPALAAGLSLMMFCMIIVPEYITYAKRYHENKEDYAVMDAVLDEIPKDASVSATAFLVPHLTERKEIYETYYHKTYDTDYLIIDIRPGYAEESLKLASGYEESGYELVRVEDDLLMVWKAPEK